SRCGACCSAPISTSTRQQSPRRHRHGVAGANRKGPGVLDLALVGFIALFLALGLKRPFFWVLAYIYIDVVAPQKIGWGFIQSLPVSLIAFAAAFLGWLSLDRKEGTRFTLRQGLILVLLVWCFITTLGAVFPEAAWKKWDWVWKALIFAAFLPLTLRTKLRIEAATLIIVLSIGTIIINGGIKTALGGGGYGYAGAGARAARRVLLAGLDGAVVGGGADLRLPADPDRSLGAHGHRLRRGARRADAALCALQVRLRRARVARARRGDPGRA